MKRLGWWLGVVLIAQAGLVSADSYVEFKGPMGPATSKSWTSGKMLREEHQIPLMGQQIQIVRVDKGVVWALNPKMKTYTESPIAIPYTPMPETKDDDNTSMGTTDDSDDSPPNCTPKMSTLAKTRKIAGQTATGTKISCKENPQEGMTSWMAPINDTTGKILADQKNYATAYAKAMYANYPAKERAEMEKSYSFLKNMMQEIPSMMGQGKWPDGYVMAMEAESKDDGAMALYEVVSLSASPVDKALFEIPAGYKKTAGGPGDGMDMHAIMEGLKNLKR